MQVRNTNLSLINQLTDKEIQNLLDSSKSFKDVVNKMGYTAFSGSLLSALRKRISESNLDVSTLDKNRLLARKSTQRTLISDSDFFTENSHHCGSSIKKRIIKNNLLSYSCAICSNLGLHNALPLVLQLDHINGINNDNRLENLRFLCPNCHSQTETYSGKRSKLPQSFCSCGEKKFKKALNCKKCYHKNQKHKTKIIWPTPELLSKEVWELPLTKLGQKYNISDVAVKKFCKKHSIPLPPHGFFLKKYRMGESNSSLVG